MKKHYKKLASFCLSLTVTAASMPMGSGLGELPKKADVSGSPVNSVSAAETALTEDSSEQFTMLTFKRDSGSFTADGKDAGQSRGGFNVDEDGTITVDIGGKTMTLDEARDEIGCEVYYNDDGDICISSPFQSSSVIVSSDKPFDSCGAVSAEEMAEGIYLLKYDSPAAAYSAYKKLSIDPSINFAEANAPCCQLENDDNMGDLFLNEYDGIIEDWGKTYIGVDKFCDRLSDEKDELPEITVAVLDSGIYAEHRFFEGRIREGGKNFVQGESAEPTDEHGHGSHCAGIICNATNDNVKILPVKVIDKSGNGSTMGIYCGMMYAIEQGANVISMSIGSFGYSNLLREAFAAAEAAGVTVCVAAGNEYADTSDFCPTFTSIDNAVVISAVDEAGEKALFSSYGRYVDFAAPGVNINSVGISSVVSEQKMSGTSMATPYAAACFADIISYDFTLSPEKRYDYMKANAVDAGEVGRDDLYGWGIVDLSEFRFTDAYINAPTVNVKGGSFTESAELTLSCIAENGEIFYTLDGSKPTKDNGIKYDGKPVKLTSTALLRAAVFVGDEQSAELKEYYTINGIADENAFEVSNGKLTRCKSDAEVLDIRALTEAGKLPEITAVAESAFKDNRTVREIILPDTVRELGNKAFYGCYSLERVESAAVVVGESTFADCTGLREFISGDLTEIGGSAFKGCEKLEKVNGQRLTVLPELCFSGCSLIGADSLNIKNIYRFEGGCLAFSGISGAVDLREMGNSFVGAQAFAGTHITEILLPPEVDTLDSGVFDGCRELKRISAPGVKNIMMRALALDKDGFTEENMVETDIDFSEIENIGMDAFYGYVFDGPVSFDSLDSYTALNIFAGAYGEEISLPTVSCLMLSGGGYTDNPSTDIKVNLLRVENAYDSFNIKDLKFNAIYTDIAPRITPDELPASGTFILGEGDADFAELCRENGLRCETFPCNIYGNGSETFLKGSKGFLRTYTLGGKQSSELYRVNADGTETLVRKDPATFTEVDTSQCGTQKYIFKVYGSDKKLKWSYPITVEIIEPQTIDIDEKSYEIIPFEDAFTDDKGIKRVNVRFVPETSGKYTVFMGEYSLELYKNGERMEEIGSFISKETPIELEAGSEYIFSLSGNMNDSFFRYCLEEAKQNLIFAVHPTADDTRNIAGTYTSIIMTDFTGTEENYHPNIFIRDTTDEYILVEGVDYEWSANDTLKIGTNSFTITGKGRYFGKLTDCTATAYRHIKEDEPMVLSYDSYDSVTDGSYNCIFTAEEDGLYTIATLPTEEQITSAMEKGALCGSDIFFPSFDVTRIVSTAPYVSENIAGDMSDSTGGVSTFTKDYRSVSVEMRAGESYILTGSFGDKRIVVTRKKVMNECKAVTEPTYPFGGSTVEPDLKVYDASGRPLVKDIDYKATYWNNDKPGIMLGVLEGMGDYAGMIYVGAAIEGSNVTTEHYNGKRVFNIAPDTEFPAMADVTYKLTMDREALIGLADLTGDNEYISANIYIIDSNDRLFSLNTETTDMILAKGEYFVTFDNVTVSGSAVSLTTEKSISVNDAEITLAPAICKGNTKTPMIKLTYGGKTIPTKEYEVIYPETVLTGINALAITGVNDHIGTAVVPYIYIPDGGSMKLGEGSNSIKVGDGEKRFCELTPESDELLLSCDSGRFVTVTVYDEEINTVAETVLNRKIFSKIELEAGKKYYVEIGCEIGESFELNITTAGILVNCHCEYDPAYPLGSEPPIHELKITDGDYTLVEGVDYVITGGCPVNDMGTNEFFCTGIGRYSGEVILPFIAYPETMPDPTENRYTTVTRGYTSIVGSGPCVGMKAYFRFASDSDKRAEYAAAVRLNNEYDIENYAIIVYDMDGKFMTAGTEKVSFTIDPDEFVYIAAVDPYIMDLFEREGGEASVFSVELVQELGDAPVTTAPVTTAPVTTTTTAEPVTTTTAPATDVPPVTTEPTEDPTEPWLGDGKLGDVNGDGFVDASDASLVLVEYSILSTGGDPTFSNEEAYAANVNGDKFIDANDASLILVFYSYLSTGGECTDMKVWLDNIY